MNNRDKQREEEIATGVCRFCGCSPCDCFDDYDDEPRECYWCGGEGWDECDDYLECTREHRTFSNDDGFVQICRCGSCGGSGLAKDMTIW